MKRALVTLMALLACSAQALADQPNWIAGTWKLTAATQTEQGQSKEYFGPKPLGQVIFAANGSFSDILVRSDLPKIASNNRTRGTAEENAAVVNGSVAFYGTYSLSGDNLKLHIEGSTFPNWENTDQTRVVHRSGDQFTWENAAGSGGGQIKLVFQRVK